MQIRVATVEDARAVWQAEVELAATPGGLVSRPEELELAAFVAKIQALSEAGSYIVAVEDGTIVGHAFVEPLPLAAITHVVRLTVAVHPGHFGRGIGTALVSHLQRWAAAAPNVHKIELNVRETNAAAIRLYRRLGFVEEGRFKHRVRLPDGRFIDDIAMAWLLRRPRATIEATAVIRPAQAGDVPELLRLYEELDETHRRPHPELFPPKVVRKSDSIERNLADPRVGLFVAEFTATSEPVVGAFVRIVDAETPGGGALLPRRFGLVDELVVAPNYRGAGVGSRLLDTAENWARERGILALEVTVWDFNTAAQALYERRGFSRLRQYYRKRL